MTDNRRFKQKVRERMAKTGESYTDARRKILEEAAKRKDAEGNEQQADH